MSSFQIEGWGITNEFEKRNTWQLTFIMLCVFVLVIAGCGKNSGNNAVEPTASSNSGENNPATEAPSEAKPITIKVSNWPKPNEEAQVKIYADYVAKMKEKYPLITVDKDEWGYDVSSFLPKAASGELPTVYETFLLKQTKLSRLIMPLILRIL